VQLTQRTGKGIKRKKRKKKNNNSDLSNSVLGVTIDWVPAPSTTVVECVVATILSASKCPSSSSSQERWPTVR